METIIFIGFIILNTMISLLYIFIHWLVEKVGKKTKGRGYVTRGIVMMLCPGIGFVFFLLAAFLNRFVYRSSVDLEDVIFNKDRVKTYTYADEEQERDIVPLEDAIIITDTENLRNLMMNVVKGDIDDSLSTIYSALDSKDSEISHYAAAVLQDTLDQFRANIQKNYHTIMTEPESHVRLAVEVIDYMIPILRQDIFSKIERISNVKMMDELCDFVFHHAPDQLSIIHYENIILRLLEIEEFEQCEQWCQRAMASYPDELISYTCQLKLYFNMGDKEKFFHIMEQLKQSDIIVDYETLEMIRVFS